MVSNHPLISKSPSSCTKPLFTVLNMPITIGIIITFMFPSFLVLWQGLSTCLSFHFLSVLPCCQSKWQIPLFVRFSFFCWWGLIIWPRFDDMFISQNPREFCISFSWTDFELGIYFLFEWSNLNFLHNSLWICPSNLTGGSSLESVSSYLSDSSENFSSVVWMIPIILRISNSYCPFSENFWDHSKCPSYNWYHHYPPVKQLIPLWQGPSICIYFCFYFVFTWLFTGWQNLFNSKFFPSCQLILSLLYD